MTEPVTEQETTADPVAVGYNLVPPPGWDRIPLQDGETNETIRRIVERAVEELPAGLPRDDISKARMELFKQLRKAAKQAAKNHGLALYLPVERIHGMHIPASFVVSEPVGGAGMGDVPSDEVLRHLAAGRGAAEPVEVDGSEGTRVERIAPAPPDEELSYASRRVEYVLPVPGALPTRWVTVTFSTIGAGHPEGELSDVLVDVFDAVMTTFRWSYA